jgi:hypothetical protein
LYHYPFGKEKNIEEKGYKAKGKIGGIIVKVLVKYWQCGRSSVA